MSTKPLQTIAPPALPLAPKDYEPRYQDQLNNILRLYFNQQQNFESVLLSASGGGAVSTPHIAAQHNAVQYATANNTPTLVKWDTLDTARGFTLYPANYSVPDYDGVYKIDYSLEFANTANTQEDVIVWLRIDGVDVPGSSSKFTVPARKSAGVYGYVVAYSSVTFPIFAGQKIELVWGTPLAYNPVGPVDGVYMYYQAAQTTPMPYPFVPSAVGAITFVSSIA
jgi:hypothetical protein